MKNFCITVFSFRIILAVFLFSFATAIQSVIAVAFDLTTVCMSIMKGCDISWGKKSFTAELHYNIVIRLTNILSYYLSIFLWEALSYDESHVIHGQSKLNWTLILQSFQIMYFLNIVLCKHKYHSNRCPSIICFKMILNLNLVKILNTMEWNSMRKEKNGTPELNMQSK